MNWLLTEIWNGLKDLRTLFTKYNVPIMPPEQPVVPVAPSKPIQTPLDTFCAAIRDYEGVPGDLNYQNNNPGNVRCSPVGYLAKYGDVMCVDTASGQFAKFPTYELGWEYLLALVQERVKEHATWDFNDFFNNYSPVSDNNHPNEYALFVANRCGVEITKNLQSLLI